MITPSALPADRHWATVPTDQLPGVLEVLKQRFWKSLEGSGRPHGSLCSSHAARGA